MNLLERIQRLVRQGRFIFYRHARIEAEKDGLTVADVVHVLLSGELIEDYSAERPRCLILGFTPGKIPVHVVCDFSDPRVIFIVTVYIPDSREWINYRIRKSR